MASRPRSSAEEHRLDKAEGHVRLVPRVRNSNPRRLTERPSGYEPDSPSSNLGEGAQRSVAQRQSIGPTNRGAQVRVLPDRRWSWCSGPAHLTVTQAAPVRPRVTTPCQMWATAAQSPVKRPRVRVPRPTRGSGSSLPCFRWRILRWPSEGWTPRSTRGGSTMARISADGTRSAKPRRCGSTPRRASNGPKPTGLRQPPPKGKTARSTRAGPAQDAHAMEDMPLLNRRSTSIW